MIGILQPEKKRDMELLSHARENMIAISVDYWETKRAYEGLSEFGTMEILWTFWGEKLWWRKHGEKYAEFQCDNFAQFPPGSLKE